MSVTLLDYANDRSNVVLYYHDRSGDVQSLAIGSGHDDEADPWFNLTGTVDDRDVWRWDGGGKPKCHRGNSVLGMSAHVDAEEWEQLTGWSEEKT